MAYIEGVAREQAALLPARVDDYVEGRSIVRFIDGFVSWLPMEALGFERSVPAATGRPGYDPRLMLALLIYGFVNGITSSRKLEREAGRNLEAIWLMRTLRPDFKTISDFRRDHKAALVGVFGEFTKLCRRAGVVSGELVAIDGSKFRAVNSKERNYDMDKLERLQKRIGERIEEYLRRIEENDAAEADEPAPLTNEQMAEKIAELRKRSDGYAELIAQVNNSGARQISTTDGESRLMKMRRGADVCYNAQIAVDSQHKLIIATEVTNEVTDQQQLGGMAEKAKAALETEMLEVVADRGYSNSVELAACEAAGVTTYVPQPKWRRNDRNGRYSKEDFTYDAQSDTYTCPAKEALRFMFESGEKKNGRRVRYYATKACAQCPLRVNCIGPRQKYRRIARRADEAVITAAAKRAAARPDVMRRRREMAEHPFGSIKRWVNGGYFLLKGLDGVRAEFSLAALAYNIRRVWNLSVTSFTCTTA
jgi:transposase